MTRHQITKLASPIILLIATGCGGSLFHKAEKTTPAKAPEKTVDAKDAPPAKINATTHFAAGQMHERENNLLAAAEQYRRAIRADGKYVMAYNRLGIVCGKLKMYDEAEQVLAAAVRLAPDAAFLWNNLAFNEMLKGDYTAAESSLHEALSRNPGYVRARINLGVVQTRTHRNTEAMETFTKVLPRDVALYNLGVLCVVDSRYVEARQAFKQVLDINPDAIDARRQLGKLTQFETNPSEAIKAELAASAQRVIGRLGPAPREQVRMVSASQPAPNAVAASQPAAVALKTKPTPQVAIDPVELEYVP